VNYYSTTDWCTCQTVVSDHKLFVKLSKCSFGMTEVEYLVHVVSGQGVAMDKLKVQAVVD
jgi:hypothetical protein